MKKLNSPSKRKWNVFNSLIKWSATFLVLMLATTNLGAATWTVTSLADNGTGTLRALMDSTSNGDTIIFSGSLNGDTIFLTSGQIEIPNSIVILGNGRTNTIISGSDLSRIFYVAPSIDVELISLTLTGGNSTNELDTDGGAIFADGDLKVDDVLIDHNFSADDGGGIYTFGTLTVTNSTISNNRADGEDGGGIDHNGDSLTIINTQIIGNWAYDDGGGADIDASDYVYMENVLVQDNEAYDGYGGGLDIYTPTIILTGCQIRLNYAWEDGGGLYAEGNVLLHDVLVDSNEAEENGGGASIYDRMVITHSTITNNTAYYGYGGGIDFGGDSLNINNTIINNNWAQEDGGGVDIYAYHAVIDSTEFTNNEADDGWGGGLFVQAAKLTITNSLVEGNKADDFSGGMDLSLDTGIIENTIIRKNQANYVGGGAYLFGCFHLLFNNVEVDSNQAGEDCGGLCADLIDSFHLRNSTISNNECALHGGGIFNLESGLEIFNSTISNNSADSGGGIFSVGNTTIINTTITQNTALDGGGIFIATDEVHMQNTILAQNIASGNGNDGLIIQSNPFAAFISNGYNLVGDTNGTSINTNTGDIYGSSASPVDALLDVLQDNGGPTQIHALLCGSPAYNTGNTDSLTDQRGEPRGAFGDDDIGAFESQTALTAALVVKGNGQEIPDGQSGTSSSDSTDFGTTITGNPVSVCYWLYNEGCDTLFISDTSITGSDAGQFLITLLQTDTIVAGDSAKLTVQYNPTNTGIHAAVVEITSNDPLAPIFDFAISGEAMDVPVPDTLLGTSNQKGSDRLGYAVDINGNYAIAGAPLVSNKKGAAYIFFKNNGGWNQQAILKPADSTEGDKFGSAVAITDEYAIIGAGEVNDSGGFSGAAYIFERSGTDWTQAAKIIPADNHAGDWYGYSVGIHDRWAIVGALGDDDNGQPQSGSAYIWKRNDGGTWIEYAKLTASDAGANDYFGFDVDMDFHTAIVGAHRNSDNGTHSGSAYIFQLTSAVWSEQNKLTAADGEAKDSFGFSVSIHGDFALVGAIGDDDAAHNAGAAYVFKRDGGIWSQFNKFTSDDASAGDEFGSAVALEKDSAFIGVYMDEPNGLRSGSAYLFRRSGTDWNQQRKITAPSPTFLDDFGFSVGISDNFAIVGASGDDTKGGNAGAVYIFNLAYSPMLVHNNEFEKFTAGLADMREASVKNASETETVPEITVKETEALDMQLYPNPTRGEVNIVWPESAGAGTIELIDARGKLVDVYESQGRISITNLSMGVYTVKMTVSDTVHYKRLVVVK